MAGKCIDELEDVVETSPVTVKNDSGEVGGYDCDFVEPPSDDLLCKICQYPARDPILTDCCGHNFCNHCMERYHQSEVIDHDKCPFCREEKFQTFPDRKTARYILSLQVFCPNKSKGCSWCGELRSLEAHLNENSKSSNTASCPFTELQCSNGCGVVVQRRLVEGHLKSECELREVKCEYCNTTDSYRWISSGHEEECPGYPVECPNHCETGHVRREEISVHLEECPLAVVKCPYAVVGCDSVVRRREKMDHVMGSVVQHMEYTMLTNQKELSVLEKRLDAKEEELERVKRDLQDTKDRLGKKEIVVKSLEKSLQDAEDRLDVKEKAITSIKQELEVTRGVVKGNEETIAENGRELNEVRKNSEQLKAAIDEKGKEMDEVRKSAEENNKSLQEMMQQLKERMERTERSLQHQLEANTQLQLQLQTVTWPIHLNYLANSGNHIIPVVIKCVDFEFHKRTQYDHWRSPGFYTRGGAGYKMCLKVFVGGWSSGQGSHVSVSVRVMKGEHDGNLNWPFKGILTVQLLNQISDSNHSEPVKFVFDGRSNNCQRVKTGEEAIYGVWCNEFISHHKLARGADKKCQYFKDDCIFFRVYNFQ